VCETDFSGLGGSRTAWLSEWQLARLWTRFDRRRADRRVRKLQDCRDGGLALNGLALCSTGTSVRDFDLWRSIRLVSADLRVIDVST